MQHVTMNDCDLNVRCNIQEREYDIYVFSRVNVARYYFNIVINVHCVAGYRIEESYVAGYSRIERF